jgi:hypothetical protein
LDVKVFVEAKVARFSFFGRVIGQVTHLMDEDVVVHHLVMQFGPETYHPLDVIGYPALRAGGGSCQHSKWYEAIDVRRYEINEIIVIFGL